MTALAALALAAVTFVAGLANGLTGFAFALIVSGTYLQFLPPGQAVPIILSLTLVSQAVHWLRRPRRFAGRQALPFILGGLVGVPIGVALAHAIDRQLFRTVIGVFLMAYSLYLLFGPTRTLNTGRFADLVVGVLSGVLGGLAGLSGALISAWCALKPWDKDTQRAAYQPFIVVGQGLALIGHVSTAGYSATVALWTLVAVPPLLGGILVGNALYRRLDELLFRRVVLALLFLAGALLLT